MQCAITDMQAQEGEGSRGESQTIPARPGPGVGFCKTGLSVLKKKKKGKSWPHQDNLFTLDRDQGQLQSRGSA